MPNRVRVRFPTRTRPVYILSQDGSRSPKNHPVGAAIESHKRSPTQRTAANQRSFRLVSTQPSFIRRPAL
ncbi:hypothetical protein PTTG_30181 [Puccinia triticina 1-1 BBBD Race 1]|uniref:Uncharacterized protein n=1 Tax=Puccinia triticina (isolate 1-1 / race 1 (BBBD)) TaxID=630390 RepID=A0A180G0I0_PUCT1|nr:hypothetical protein PTTG_30181 [Puccinia triticina 1-1 BBBD Race 1]